jgi:tetratricopeptide (TPR) repeat protein
MSYPGDKSLDAKIQQRILSAFAEAVRLYQEGNPEECRTVLRSILEVDPSFAPAARLMAAVDAGAPVDLAKLLGDVGAAGGLDVDATIAKARQAFAARAFDAAAELANQVLRELPCQEEARQLVQAAESRIKSAGDVATRLAQAREALQRGARAEAQSFLELARNLDPSNPDVAALAATLAPTARVPALEAPVEFEFIPAPSASVGGGRTNAFGPPLAPSTTPPRPAPPRTSPSPPTITPSPPPTAANSAEAEFAFGGPTPALPVPEMDLFSVDDAPAASASPGAEPPAFAASTAVPLASVPPLTPEVPAPLGTPLVPPPPTAPSAAPPEPPSPAPSAVPVRAAPPPPEAGAPARDAGDSATRVHDLLAQGQEEFDKGDFQGAIETWSRIYLIQTDCHEADEKIEEARRRREEIERQADHRFYEAREAFDHGRLDEARTLCQDVLKLQPQHLEAHDLLARLETPAAPPPPPMGAQAGEEDLFRDDFAPAAPTPTPARSARGPVARPLDVASEAKPRKPRLGFAAKKLSLPLPLLALFGGLVVVLAVVGLLLRSTLFGGRVDVVASTIAQAQDAAHNGRLQEAINLLKSLQATEPLDGSIGNQVNQRILDYQRRLRSKATPPPTVPDKPIRDALAQGRRVEALRLVRQGLTRVPGDSELTRMQSEILAYSSTLGALADAVDARDMEKVRRNAQSLLDQHPDDAEARGLWSAATFNLALVMLRKYQVGSAKALLDELARRGDDEEIDRMRAFADRYIAKPVDPRYQIFVTNVELRPLE